jgi:hypothetical protein
MKGHIRERSPGHWAIVIEMRDPVTGKRKRQPTSHPRLPLPRAGIVGMPRPISVIRTVREPAPRWRCIRWRVPPTRRR